MIIFLMLALFIFITLFRIYTLSCQPDSLSGFLYERDPK